MAQDFKTSFIPKKNMQQTPQQQRRSGSSGAGVLLIIALIIFLVTFAGGVGAFLYKTFLERTITQKEESLEQARAAFDPELIRELKQLDQRLTVAHDLLGTHVAPSVAFAELERITLENVSFTSFDLAARNGDIYTLKLEGEARDFAAVAQQSELFGESAFIDEPVFSDLDVNDAGDVVFEVTAQLDATEMRYADNLSAYQQPATTTNDSSQ